MTPAVEVIPLPLPAVLAPLARLSFHPAVVNPVENIIAASLLLIALHPWSLLTAVGCRLLSLPGIFGPLLIL
jgi:hypothetical protein